MFLIQTYLLFNISIGKTASFRKVASQFAIEEKYLAGLIENGNQPLRRANAYMSM